MSDNFLLTPDSGSIKGNNPYSLSRMKVDPSFRQTSRYDLASIQGYNALGDVVLKGEQLAFGDRTEEPTCISFAKKPTCQVQAWNAGGNVASYTECPQPKELNPEQIEQFGPKGYKKKKHRAQRLKQLQQLIEHRNNQCATAERNQSENVEEAFCSKNFESVSSSAPVSLSAGWTLAFGNNIPSGQSKLSNITQQRYNSIFKEKSGY